MSSTSHPLHLKMTSLPSKARPKTSAENIVAQIDDLSSGMFETVFGFEMALIEEKSRHEALEISKLTNALEGTDIAEEANRGEAPTDVKEQSDIPKLIDIDGVSYREVSPVFSKPPDALETAGVEKQSGVQDLIDFLKGPLSVLQSLNEELKTEVSKLSRHFHDLVERHKKVRAENNEMAEVMEKLMNGLEVENLGNLYEDFAGREDSVLLERFQQMGCFDRLSRWDSRDERDRG